MKKKLVLLSGAIMGFAPLLALAQSGSVRQGSTGAFNGCSGVGLGTISGILCKIGDILNIVVPLLMGLAIIYFIWGVITYVIAGDEEAKTAGRDRMIFGIIGLVVIVGVWGLVKIVTATFGVDTSVQPITYPAVQY